MIALASSLIVAGILYCWFWASAMREAVAIAASGADFRNETVMAQAPYLTRALPILGVRSEKLPEMAFPEVLSFAQRVSRGLQMNICAGFAAVVAGGLLLLSGMSAESNAPLRDGVSAQRPSRIRTLLSFRGRWPRRDYWLCGFLPLFPIGIANDILFYAAPGGIVHVVSIVVGILSLWPGFAITVKRLHDRNRSGWFAALVLIPVVGLVFLIVEVWFLKGTTGPNRFGTDPLDGR
jgi:uncharacterized membrane protein YhaH (DUF805 family)